MTRSELLKRQSILTFLISKALISRFDRKVVLKAIERWRKEFALIQAGLDAEL